MINASQPRYGIGTVLVISVKRLLPVELRGIAATLGRPKSARPCRPDELRRRSQIPQLSRPGSVTAMAGFGHEERFPPTRLGAACGFRKETIAGMRRNGRDAPRAVIPATAIGPRSRRVARRNFTSGRSQNRA
jgi:hypothetical protein